MHSQSNNRQKMLSRRGGGGGGGGGHGGGGGGSYMNTGHSTFIAEQGIRGPNALAGSILVELL